MNKFGLVVTMLASCLPVAYAGKWDTAARAVYLVSKEPEKAFSAVGFLIDLFLMCIPAAIVGGIVSIILKSVFNLDKEDTQKAFFITGGILLAILLLVYFLA